MRAWSMVTGQETATYGGIGGGRNLQFSRDGTTLAVVDTSSGDTTVRTWDARSGGSPLLTVAGIYGLLSRTEVFWLLLGGTR